MTFTAEEPEQILSQDAWGHVFLTQVKNWHAGSRVRFTRILSFGFGQRKKGTSSPSSRRRWRESTELCERGAGAL